MTLEGRGAFVQKHATHLDLLDLSLQTSDIRITLRRRLVQLHHVDRGVHIVPHDPDHGVTLVIHQDRTTGLQEVLVDKGHDRHVRLPASGSGDDGVVVVDDLFQRPDGHGRTAEGVDLGPVFGGTVVTGPGTLEVLRLVGDEL